MNNLLMKLLYVSIILLIGMQITIKVFNHTQPIFSIIPFAITIMGIYLTLKTKKQNEKN